MEYTTLGHSNIKVSKLCLGCMSFGVVKGFMHEGWALNEEDSTKVIHKAYEDGINFFDTAMIYAKGESEKIVGKALNALNKRDELVVATKFLPRTPEEIASGISGKEHVRRNLDESLKRLNMDYVDLYICHMWDYNTNMYEVLEGMSEAVKEGKVRAIGMSNCYAYQLALLNEYAKAHGLASFTSLQGHYNLIFREEEREMVPYCNEMNIALTPYSPLASGRLAKEPGEISARLTTDYVAKGKYEANAHTKACDDEIIKRVGEMAKKHNTTRIAVSLSYLMQKTTSPIFGASKLSHVDDALKALDVKLSADDVKYLEEPYVAHDLVGVMLNNRPNANFSGVINNK